MNAFSSAAACDGATIPMCAALRLTTDGPVVWREPVLPADLAEPRGEFWFQEVLRHGGPGVGLGQIGCEMTPIPSRERPDELVGYQLVGRGGDGGRRSTVFSPGSLKAVASRAAQRLLARSVLKDDDLYYYELQRWDGAAPGAGASPKGPAHRLVPRAAPLKYLELPLAPLLEQALSVGEHRDWEYPVFYTHSAYAHAQRCARRGAARQPPVETGAMLVGPLCSCAKTGEMFGVVCLVLEMEEAQEQRVSLELSATSWSRIQAAMARVQSQPATAAFRLLGQAHGHPFSPGGDDDGKPHSTLRTSVFVSEDDRAWSRAVFPRQPWHLCHIFGQDEQGKPVDGLFGQRDCTLMRRGFYLLPASEGFDVLAQARLCPEVVEHG